MGYEAPEVEVVDAKLGYAIRWFRVPENLSGNWKASLSCRAGLTTRVAAHCGGSRVAYGRPSYIGLGGDHPPTDEEGFLGFARTLPSPIIYNVIKDAEPASSVYGYRRTANRRRFYERARLPKGLLVLGDAPCFLNPLYGSGMTAVALSAETLDKCIREQERRRTGPLNLSGFGRRFHERQAKAVAPCWTMTTNSDLQWAAESVEDLGATRRLLYHLSEEVLGLAVEREDVAKTLLEVKNLLKPPSALLHPGILLPALRWAPLSFFSTCSAEQREPRVLEPAADEPGPEPSQVPASDPS